MSQNPFKVGDTVVYKPSKIGRDKSLMTDLGKLQPGQRYEVVGIEKGIYLVLRGFESSPGGGLHWSEFEKEEQP